MDTIGNNARKVLEYINDKERVMNNDLISAFQDDTFFYLSVLEQNGFVRPRFSSNDSYDYYIQPKGRDYLERYATEHEKLDAQIKHQKSIDGNVREIKSDVSGIHAQIEHLNRKISDLEIKAEQQKERAELAEKKAIAASQRFTVAVTVFGAVVSLGLSVLMNWITS